MPEEETCDGCRICEIATRRFVASLDADQYLAAAILRWRPNVQEAGVAGRKICCCTLCGQQKAVLLSEVQENIFFCISEV
jgi:hypothetical protein